jgi:hypothetical protein
MKKLSTQYLVGIAMLFFSLYQLSKPDFWEAALYLSAGLAFISMGLIKDNVFERHKKLLTIVSWALIIISGFMLLFLIRTDV